MLPSGSDWWRCCTWGRTRCYRRASNRSYWWVTCDIARFYNKVKRLLYTFYWVLTHTMSYFVRNKSIVRMYANHAIYCTYKMYRQHWYIHLCIEGGGRSAFHHQEVFCHAWLYVLTFEYYSGLLFSVIIAEWMALSMLSSMQVTMSGFMWEAKYVTFIFNFVIHKFVILNILFHSMELLSIRM